MRIISGSLGGRIFKSPGTFKTHPMSDKIRGALFAILGDIEGLTVLDAFAGSGALSFEAVSRGALSATAIEVDRAAQNVISENIAALALDEKITLVRVGAGAWLNSRSDTGTFDIILCDPPYNDLQINLINRLTEAVAKDGLLVVSWPTGTQLPDISGFNLIEHRSYGDAQLGFYRR